MEQGEVVEPYKPMLRFAAPVFDLQGRKRGVVVLNYLGGVILDAIGELFKQSENQVYLIDQAGYFLLSPSASDQWGFMFNRSVTFASHYPVAWRLLKDHAQGSLQGEHGQFIYQTLTMGLPDESQKVFANNRQQWKIVIQIRDWTLSWQELQEHPIALMILVCGVLLSIFVAWIVTLFILMRRVSEQAEAEALRELEFQKRALDEHAIVSATDVRGVITYVNDRFVTISGYSREQLIGQNHRMVKSNDHPLEFYQEMWKTIAAGHSWHGEVKNRAADGSYYWVRATIVPFLNARGKPFKYVSIRTDITAMKALESGLLVAKEQAEAAGRAKSDFLANMSHEIRTPMNAIIGLSHLCLQTQLTVRQQDYIRKVHNAATSLLRIINDILDFSKIDAGRLDMECIDFTLEEVLGTLSSMIALKAQEKRLEFLMETDTEIPPSLKGDPLRLGQVLINLTNNAIKFTEKGEVVIETRVLTREEESVRLQFIIRDTGIGMTSEQMAGLFQAFSQADSSITRKYGGTGLGLTIAKRLIEMMGGTIRVESEAGRGTRFIFDVVFGVSNQVMVPSVLPTMDLRGLKALVVDDNESAREIIGKYLASFTFKVTRACNAREVMIFVQEADMMGEPFDLIVIDFMMPEMDGITAVAKMRHELSLSRFPKVIMATAYGEEPVVKRAVSEAQVDDFLVKPINQSLLFESIMDVFGHARNDDRRGNGPVEATRDGLERLSGARILLVEDNEINQQVAKELLEQVHVVVLLAENGLQALDVIGKEPLDGVLMDLQMPVMDGLTATREIRQDPRFANLPILAMTANAMSGDRELCLQAGMQDHIAKPVDPEEMYATLIRWIKPAHPQPVALSRERSAPESRAVEDGLVIPELPGVDTRTGLLRMAGNVQGYLNLLVKFRVNQSGVDGVIREALVQHDDELAERHAHTLKGVAGAIGANTLADAAKELESAIKKRLDAGKIEQALQVMGRELTQLCTLLDQALPPPSVEERVASVEEVSEQQRVRRDALFRKAVGQLANYDAAIEETLVVLRSVGGSQEMLEWLSRLEHLVAQYDYEGAAESLQQCLVALGVEQEGEDAG